jgi:hypothetical protein
MRRDDGTLKLYVIVCSTCYSFLFVVVMLYIYAEMVQNEIIRLSYGS